MECATARDWRPEIPQVQPGLSLKLPSVYRHLDSPINAVYSSGAKSGLRINRLNSVQATDSVDDSE